jgi:hypothetical protein
MWQHFGSEFADAEVRGGCQLFLQSIGIVL